MPIEDIDDVIDAVDELAMAPAAVQGDMGSVTEHNLKDALLWEDRRRGENAAVNNSRGGLRMKTMVPGGAGGQ